MNLPPAVLVIIAAVAVANVLVLLAVLLRARAERARELVQADGLMSSSYRDDAASRDDASEDAAAPAGGWLAAGERFPTARHRWQDAADDWPAPTWPAPDRFATARRNEADRAAVEPFEFPAPTALEQRSQQVDGDTGDDEWIEDEHEIEVDDDVEIAAEADDVEITADADAEAEAEDHDDIDDEGPEDDVHVAEDEEMVAADLEAETEDDTMPTTIGSAQRGGRDGLTGLLDARAFEEVMSHEEAREQRYGRPATVIVFELDGLTKLVDRLGAEPGDRIEAALADTIRRLARGADHVARLERGRYAALLPETDEVAAINYVERIRRACELWLESGAIAMRLSIGWASTSGDAGLSGALRVATDRMRAELRRNVRAVGDIVAGAEAIDADEPPQLAAAG